MLLDLLVSVFGVVARLGGHTKSGAVSDSSSLAEAMAAELGGKKV
jgi:hypothetical protein